MAIVFFCSSTTAIKKFFVIFQSLILLAILTRGQQQLNEPPPPPPPPVLRPFTGQKYRPTIPIPVDVNCGEYFTSTDIRIDISYKPNRKCRFVFDPVLSGKVRAGHTSIELDATKTGLRSIGGDYVVLVDGALVGKLDFICDLTKYQQMNVKFGNEKIKLINRDDVASLIVNKRDNVTATNASSSSIIAFKSSNERMVLDYCTEQTTLSPSSSPPSSLRQTTPFAAADTQQRRVPFQAGIAGLKAKSGFIEIFDAVTALMDAPHNVTEEDIGENATASTPATTASGAVVALAANSSSTTPLPAVVAAAVIDGNVNAKLNSSASASSAQSVPAAAAAALPDTLPEDVVEEEEEADESDNDLMENNNTSTTPAAAVVDNDTSSNNTPTAPLDVNGEIPHVTVVGSENEESSEDENVDGEVNESISTTPVPTTTTTTTTTNGSIENIVSDETTNVSTTAAPTAAVSIGNSEEAEEVEGSEEELNEPPTNQTNASNNSTTPLANPMNNNNATNMSNIAWSDDSSQNDTSVDHADIGGGGSTDNSTTTVASNNASANITTAAGNDDDDEENSVEGAVDEIDSEEGSEEVVDNGVNSVTPAPNTTNSTTVSAHKPVLLLNDTDLAAIFGNNTTNNTNTSSISSSNNSSTTIIGSTNITVPTTTTVKNCSTAIDELFDKSVCGKPIVSPEHNAVNPRSLKLDKNSWLADESLLYRFYEESVLYRIINGTDAEEGAWPWTCNMVVATNYSGVNVPLQVDMTRRFCGATVIARQWLLTAAHCFRKAPETFFDIAEPRMFVCGARDVTDLTRRQLVGIESIFIHPNFSFSSKFNDIALVKVSTPLRYTDTLKPACLPEAEISALQPPKLTPPPPTPPQPAALRRRISARTFISRRTLLPITRRDGGAIASKPAAQQQQQRVRCFVAGWGIVEDGTRKQPKIINQVAVDYITKEECLELTRNATANDMLPASTFEAVQNIPHLICAGVIVDAAAKSYAYDSCQGDSGGTLVCYDHAQERWLHHGVVSFGFKCGQRNVPGFYSGVYHFREWIMRTMMLEENGVNAAGATIPKQC